MDVIFDSLIIFIRFFFSTYFQNFSMNENVKIILEYTFCIFLDLSLS